MNSGQCHRFAQFHGGLAMNSPYVESPESSAQTFPVSFDGLSRAPEQQLLTTASPSSNLYSSNYTTPNPISMSPSPTLWADSSQISASFQDSNNNICYNYLPPIGGNDPYGGEYLRNGNYFTSVPRTMPYSAGYLNDGNISLANLEPSLYPDPSKSELQNSTTHPSMLATSAVDSSRAFERLSISTSPRTESNAMGNDGLQFKNQQRSYRMPLSDSDDGGHSSREMTAVDAEDHGAEEPYAKLIYRALMSAPNHSMVLQEIYQWFRENTIKGSSDTKGWMNSIRHNLSMNAAFKKTERKVLGDETKKSTEWVLEDFAIRDGVQSTTRYRKGNGTKKFTKSENPAPARQVSGRKGGICTSKNKLQRQRVREERLEYRTLNQRFDSGRRSQYQYQGRPLLSTKRPRSPSIAPQIETKRQRSPLTPPNIEHIGSSSSSPYPLSKPENYDISFEDIYRLQDVQGVSINADSPLFSNDQDTYFHSNHSLASTSY